jgi:hypothetical protein
MRNAAKSDRFLGKSSFRRNLIDRAGWWRRQRYELVSGFCDVLYGFLDLRTGWWNVWVWVKLDLSCDRVR